METTVVPNLHPYASVDRDYFRQERLYNAEMDMLLTDNAAVLQVRSGDPVTSTGYGVGEVS